MILRLKSLVRTRICFFIVFCISLAACSREEAPAAAATPTAPGPEAATTALVDSERIINADAEPGNWLSNGRTYSEQRYSPLDQINEATVGELGLAWYLDLDTSRGQQASPLVEYMTPSMRRPANCFGSTILRFRPSGMQRPAAAYRIAAPRCGRAACMLARSTVV